MICIRSFMQYRAYLTLYTILSILLAIPCWAETQTTHENSDLNETSTCHDTCRPNMPYVDSECIPIGMQALGTAIVLGSAFKLFRSHDGENEWDTIGIGYKLAGAVGAMMVKELWDQINKCITAAIIVATWERCKTCQI